MVPCNTRTTAAAISVAAVAAATWIRPPDGSDAWLFEAVLDYGEHDADAPTPSDARPVAARRLASITSARWRSGAAVRSC